MLSILKKIIKSIALVPILLALTFFILAIIIAVLKIDYENYTIFKPLIVTEKKDVQFILTLIIGGIFTLTIFSYTMVMNVLNRNINNYSPRLIPLLLSEKHHQVILGFTSGTIIYAMVLSIATVSKNNLDIPNIGASLGVIFSIICVFLFIYFIHSVSQSIHINYILLQVFDRTEENMKRQDETHKFKSVCIVPEDTVLHYYSEIAGYLHQPNYSELLKLADMLDCKIVLHKLPGEFVYRDELLFSVTKTLHSKKLKLVISCFAINNDVTLDVPETGFKHLIEVAIKASSPALNDPGTSKDAIDYLTQLFLIRKTFPYHNEEWISLKNSVFRKQLTTNKFMHYSYKEMKHFMRNDPLLDKHLNKSFSRLENNKQT